MAFSSESAVGFQHFVVGSTVVTLPGTVNGRRVARVTVTCETANIRYRYDGGNPAAGAGEGHVLTPQSTVIIEGPVNIMNFKMVSDSTSDVAVTYEAI